MAASASVDMVDMGRDGVARVAGIAFEVQAAEWNENNDHNVNGNQNNGSPQSVPKRLRRRLMEAVENKPSTLQEIEAKLKEADLRRQQFHEWLANKARSKPKSPTHSANPEYLAQRLEAKLSAAEQKRLELLSQAQMRLAKSDELRQAAKTEVQLRAEREREELESKVESRVQQAESNRMALLEAEKQRRAAAQERMANSHLQRMVQEDKDKERKETLHATICQRVAAAEEKRLGILEAEKTRAHLSVMQARRVANSVSLQREMEMRKRKEKLENRLQRAKRKRAELLRQRGRFGGASHINRHKMVKHGERLSRKLARVWRQFQRSSRTTYTLTQEFAACEISHSTVNSLPFEKFAARIQSLATLQSVTALLARIERWFMASQHSDSNIASIDHLLKRISLGNKRTPPNGNRVAKRTASQGSVKATNRSQKEKTDEKEPLRYPARVFLCAYMILGHPEAVFSGRGERETALAEAATRLVPEFESLIHIILDGPSCSPYSTSPSLNKEACSWDFKRPQTSNSQRPFAAQLAAFDAAWCSYLYQFVVWKVKDAQSLEEDLIRVACQLELSMLQKCKITSGGEEGNVSHDIKAIRRQVVEDQQLLQDKILRLSGSSGMARMGAALSDVRSRFMEAKENGSPLLSPFSPASFPSSSTSMGCQKRVIGKPKKVARSLFKSRPETENPADASVKSSNSLGDADKKKLLNDNEIMVNDILHDRNRTFADTVCGMNKSSDEFTVKIKSTMETAFWDCVKESLTSNPPDYAWVIKLVEEVRNELVALVPVSWKQEILDSIDTDLLSQILESGSQDVEYLSKLLEYSLGVVLKLAIPANDNESKAKHGQLFHELSDIVVGMDKETNSSFAQVLVKGLRFILEQIQVLKKDISVARIRSLEPLVQGLAGVRYLQEAFTTRCGPYSRATRMLPRTVQWLTSVRQTVEQQKSDFLTALIDFRNSQPSVLSTHASGLPPVTSLRTGGRLDPGKGLPTIADNSVLPAFTGSLGGTVQEIQWNSQETLVRLGLLQLTSKPDAVNEETMPETLKLNAGRLQKAQNDFQHIIVIATSMLLVRQTLTGKGVPAAEIDSVLHDVVEQLKDILSNPALSVHHIGRLLSQLCMPLGENEESSQELMTRILNRSLSVDDAVFVKISAAIIAGLRAILLGVKGFEGRSLAQLALKRIGASPLVDLLAGVADALDVIATVTCQVHGPWYVCIAGEI
ncbi:hypothetical protein SUGI_0279530 [Cryptomeria japonica]|uniref:uncharacterized protein LOC131075668 n=1 Tax=Cryptomeria japonica TaxID=3369 RepID=UPI002408CF35|nr:uncharacterized protein LOC131075668 [Cryptomeria japonica]GLJ16432.1 hypothetical protein SUGI_0279530 [Cryptomeria japonica]